MSNETLDTTTNVVPETPTSGDAATTKPDFIQDKFWDADRNEPNLEALATSYNSLEKKLGSRTEELSKQIREDYEKEKLASAPQEYKLEIKDIPENVSIEVADDMPIVQWWKETAKSNGLSQEQFDQGVKMFVDNAIAGLPDPQEEMQKLGDAAKERIEAAELWSKKNLSPNAYNVISSIAATAEGVEALEEIMKLSQNSPIPTTTTVMDVTPDLNDLKSMMNDPRYYDSAKRDPSYVKRVTELYEKAFQNKKG